MQSALSYVRKLDFLSSSYSITYKQKQRSKTLVGSTLSLMLFGLMVIASYFFGRDIVFRKEPITRMTQEYREDNKIYLKDAPTVMLPLSKYGDQIMDSPFMNSFELEAYFYSMEPLNNQFVVTYNKVPVEVCSETNMTQENFELLSKDQDPSKFFCVNPFYYLENGERKRKDLYFQNPFGFYKSAFISIRVVKCDETANPSCSKPFEQENYFFLNQYIFGSFIDLTDFHEPTKKYINNITHEIPYLMYTRNFVKMSINKVITDEGFIFKTERESTFYSLSNERITSKVNDYEDNIYAIIHSEVSFMRNIYLRRYLKLQEILANVGGFMKASFFIGQMLVKNYSSYAFFCELSKDFPSKTSSAPVAPLGSQSVSRVSAKKEIVQSNPSFWQYFVSSVSTKKALKYKLNAYNCFKYTDIFFIAGELRKLEEENKEDDNVISRLRHN